MHGKGMMAKKAMELRGWSDYLGFVKGGIVQIFGY